MADSMTVYGNSYTYSKPYIAKHVTNNSKKSFVAQTNTNEFLNYLDSYKVKDKQSDEKGSNTGLVVLSSVCLAIAADLIFAKGKHINTIIKSIKGKSSQIGKNVNKTAKDTTVNVKKITNELNEEDILNKIKESDARNQKWLEQQHAIKEKEYSDWWNKALEEKKAAEEAKKTAEKVRIAKKPQKKIVQIDLNSPLEIKYDALSGNYYGQKILKKNLDENPQIVKVMEELKDVTFDSKNLKLMKDVYNKDNPYDLGLRYAILANNTAKQKGVGAVINEVPDMFKGIETEELIKKIDNLASYVKRDKINKFKIGNKDYTAELIGGGCLSDVYKITDEATGEIVCIKFARQPYLTGRGQGIFDEVAITNEANKAGVVDVPKLYMANPIGRYVESAEYGGCITNNGAWQMTEFIEPDRKVSEKGLRLLDWLKSKGLYHGDCHSGNYIGDMIIDLGGILDTEHTFLKFADMENLLKAYQNNESTESILKMLNNKTNN